MLVNNQVIDTFEAFRGLCTLRKEVAEKADCEILTRDYEGTIRVLDDFIRELKEANGNV